MTFRYAQGSDPLDWHFLCAVDPRRLFPEGKVDAPLLQRILETVAFGRVSRDDASALTADHVSHLFQLCQILIQYVTYSQERLVVANSTLITRNKSLETDNSALQGKVHTVEADLASSHKEVKAQRRTLMAFEFERAYKSPSAASTGGQFRCNHCSESYQKEESLTSHIRKRHTIVNVVQQQPAAAPFVAAPPPVVLTHPEVLQMQSQIADLRTQLQFERDRQLRMMQQPAQMGPTIAPDYSALMAAASRFAVPQPLQPAAPTATTAESNNSDVLAQIEKTLQKLVERTTTQNQPTTVIPLPPQPATDAIAKPPPKVAVRKPWLRLSSELSKDTESVVEETKVARHDSFESLATPPGPAPPKPETLTAPILDKPLDTIKADSFVSSQIPPADPLPPKEPTVTVVVPTADVSLVKPVDSMQPHHQRGSIFGDLSVSSVPMNTHIAPTSGVITVMSAQGAAAVPVNEDTKLDASKSDFGNLMMARPIGHNPLAMPPPDPSPMIANPPNVRVLDESSILSHNTDHRSTVIPTTSGLLPQPSVVVPSGPVTVTVPPRNDPLQSSMLTDVLGVSQQNTSLPLPASSLPPGFEFAPTSISVVPIPVVVPMVPTAVAVTKPVEVSRRRSPSTSSSSTISSRSSTPSSRSSDSYYRRKRSARRRPSTSSDDSYDRRRRSRR